MTEFISRNYGHESYEIIIKTTSHDHYRATEEFARRLIDHAKPQSNADRIRTMSDEELAEWALYKAKEIGREYNDSFLGLIKWLKQPAEVDHESS